MLRRGWQTEEKRRMHEPHAAQLDAERRRRRAIVQRFRRSAAAADSLASACSAPAAAVKSILLAINIPRDSDAAADASPFLVTSLHLHNTLLITSSGASEKESQIFPAFDGAEIRDLFITVAVSHVPPFFENSTYLLRRPSSVYESA